MVVFKNDSIILKYLIEIVRVTAGAHQILWTKENAYSLV